MVSKEEIRRWTGLHHKTIDKMVSLLEKKDIDWEQVIDWYTLGQEAREFGDIEKEVWRKLAAEYGISKPIELGREFKEMEEKEIEYLLSSQEGVKQLLTRIYKNGLKPKEREILKEKILGRPDLATLIALYNGEAQEYAKRYLAEMVVAPTREDVKELLKADKLKIHSERGWIKSINDIPLKKPLKSIDLVEYIADYDLLASQKADGGTVAVYSKEKPSLKPLKSVDPEQLRMGIKVEMEHTDDPQIAEKIARDHLMEISDYYTRLIKMEEKAIKKPRLRPVEPVKEIVPKKEEKPVVAVIEPSEAKIDELAITYSYGEVAKIAKDNNIRVSGSKIKILSELIKVGVL